MTADGAAVVPFGDRLAAAMDLHGPVCVGIDPHPGLLESWGLADDAAGLRSFGLRVVEALGGRVAALKPQSAFFERHGSAGVAALEDVLAAARAAGTLTVLDVKRGDIGSTMAGYADAYLGDGAPLAADAVTLSPYLGFGSLRPALDLARRTGRGVFVLALTSNPEGASVQHARTRVGSVAGRGPVIGTGSVARAGSPPGAGSVAGTGSAPGTRSASGAGSPTGAGSVAGEMVDGARAENEAAPGERLGSVGLVVGATVGSAVAELGLDLAAVRGPLLAPGVGAQGAGAAELAEVFGAARGQVLASTSRGVLGAGPGGLADALDRAVEQARAALGR